MGLVEYSSLDEDEQKSDGPTSKRRRIQENSRDRGNLRALPKLPDDFHDLYAVVPRLSTGDDATLHQGRKRAVPHAEGNWPTHVYLEWMPEPRQLVVLQDLVDLVQQKTPGKMHSSLRSSTGAPLPLHVSLSAPLILRTEQREGFLEEMQQAVDGELRSNRNEQGTSTRSHGITLRLNGLKWAANHERNRWFLAAGIHGPDSDELNNLLGICNRIASLNGLPMLYVKSEEVMATGQQKEDESSLNTIPDYSTRFHFSVAWSLENPMCDDRIVDPVDVPPMLLRRLEDIEIVMQSAKVKIGNSINSITLV
ncbi:MAG: hypothetical protein Q9159_000057 [Coniocarpon cinnabarinum]